MLSGLKDRASLDTEIPSEKYRLGRIVQSARLAYLQIHKAKVALNFPTISSRSRHEKTVGTCFSPLLIDPKKETASGVGSYLLQSAATAAHAEWRVKNEDRKTRQEG